MKAVAGGSSRKGKGTSSPGRQPPSADATRAPRRSPGPLAARLALHLPAPPRVSRAPNRKAPPFYDEVAKKIAGLSAGHRSLAPLQDMLALAKLVEAGSAKDVPAAVTAVLASGNGMGDLEFPSTDFSDALVTRVFLMGLPDESRRLRAFFVPKEAKGTFGRGELSPELRLWTKIVEAVLARAKSGSVSDAAATIDDVAATSAELRKVTRALDMKDVAWSQRLYGGDPYSPEKAEDYQFGGSMFGRTTLSGFFMSLRALQQKLFTAAQMSFQTLMDAAIADLGAGKGVAGLDLAEQVLEGKIAPLVDLSDAIPFTSDWYPRPSMPERLRSSGEQPVDVTRSTYKGKPGGGGKHHDVFGATKKHAPVGFQLYDPEKSYGKEKEMTLRRIVEVRRRQIAFLRGMFASMGTTGKFELHGDESWRTFLLTEVKARQVKDGDTAALSFAIRLLEEYLASFTIMSPNDIDDFGDNYLKRTFPRALTGQLIHDCGVYALRIAYALSAVRDLLKLEFRFVRLPSHLALTVSGPTIDGAFVFNNNQVFPITKAVMDGFRATWSAQKPKRTEDELMGHVAAGTYIEKVDMPFRVEAVPSDPSAARLKDRMWAAYGKVSRTDVLGRPKDSSLDAFNLRYLDVMEERKRMRNAYAFSIFTLWGVHGPRLTEQARAVKSTAKGAAARYRATAKEYRAALDRVREGFRKDEDSLAKRREAIDAALAKNPDLIAKGATKAEWKILDPTFQWEKVLDAYLAKVDAAEPEPDFVHQFPTTD